jgi:transposase
MNPKNVSQDYFEKKLFVGIDVHLKNYAVTVVFEGSVIKKWSMPSDGMKLIEMLKSLYSGAEIQSAYEAGFSGFVLHRILTEHGIKNLVVHAASIAVNDRDRVKTDKRDSEKLARQLAAGMLKGIHVPTIEEEYKRQLTRTRDQLVKERTRVMVQIRRRLYHFGYELCTGKVLNRKLVIELINTLPESALTISVKTQLRIWESLEKEIKHLEQQLKVQAKKCDYETLYRTIPGIGRISARVLANELFDMNQFKNEKALFSYVGLTPTESSSGDKIRRGHISRQGKSMLRKILVEAAWVAIKKDRELKAYYAQLFARAGGKKAIVAVARKLIGRARAIFKTGEVYRLVAA